MAEAPMAGTDEAATAANLTDANSTAQQDPESAESSQSLTRWSHAVSLTDYFSSLALRSTTSAKCDYRAATEESLQQEAERRRGTTSADLASNLASLSIRAREEDTEEEQQLLPAAKRFCPGLQHQRQNAFKLPKTYSCGYCDKAFHSAARYCRHLHRHSNLWRCDKCNRGFESHAVRNHHRRHCVKLWRHRNRRKYYG